MKKKIRLLICYGLLVLLVASCQNMNRSTTTPTVTPENSTNWWTTWLIHPACKPPCWQNITPGMTTRDEAVAILQNSPEFESVSSSKYGVSWVFTQNKAEGGTLSISEDEKVNAIWVGSVSDNKLLLKSIASSYNYPEYLKPYDCREGKCAALLIYPALGMFLSVDVENTGIVPAPQFELLPETSIDRVYFFKPGIENFEKLSFQDYDELLKWKGYGKYP